jgi:hypothetical protein
MIGMAKPSVYPVNGTGRDSYIALNNGGLYRGYEPYPAADIGTFTTKKRPQSSLATIEAKHVGYSTNGTGRDTYILYTFTQHIITIFSSGNGGYYPS